MAKSVELVFVVDESGSMYHLKGDTIGGLNSVLDDNRAGEGDVFVTLVTFSDEARIRLEHEPIANVEPFGDDDYSPSGCTALLDAVGSTVKSLRRHHKRLPKDERPNTIVVIITDGEENASRKFDNDKVKRLVEKRKRNGWEFIFLGANIDAFAAASGIGIDASRASRYVSDQVGSVAAFSSVKHAMSSYRVSGEVSADWAAAATADAESRA